jgi:hypothetical protein
MNSNMKTNQFESEELIHSVLEALAQRESLLMEASDEGHTRKVAVAVTASCRRHRSSSGAGSFAFS